MLGIEIRLLTVFYTQIDRQLEQINQELEQYLRFYKLQAEGLAGVVSNSGVCSKQQCSFSK